MNFENKTPNNSEYSVEMEEKDIVIVYAEYGKVRINLKDFTFKVLDHG